MANCSIPSSTPAIGRISTPLSRRSRKQNSSAGIPPQAIAPWPLGFFNAQRSTLNAQYSIQTVGRWMLGVERWAFFSWRVKGAWWSSRSSKPLSVPHTRGRGRFDSYPLRQVSVVILSGAKRSRRTPWPYRKLIHRASSTSLGMTNNAKGGDYTCHVS
jgi:hypothetical protein